MNFRRTPGSAHITFILVILFWARPRRDVRPDGYVLLTDTTCNKLLFATIHVSSTTIDKISDDIYNLTLFKKSGSDTKVKIVAVENSSIADQVAQKFFYAD